MGTGSFIGKPVNVDQVLQLSTAWACVRLISQTLAALPLGFYQRQTDGTRTTAARHPLYTILHNQPNANQTSIVFWESVIASLLLWGNAYVEVKRSGGVVVALYCLHPARVTVRRQNNGALEYRYRDSLRSPEQEIPPANMMHILAFDVDGIGISPVLAGVNVFGAAIETDRASAETFRDSLKSPGLVTMDVVLKKDQREEIRRHVREVSDAGGIMVLEKGAGFEKMGFDPVTAELLRTREYNTEEICRWFGVDPAMVGHGGKDSNWGTGLEEKMLWFLMFALRNWAVRIEQAIWKSLLTPVERQTYYAEWNMEGLQRGNSTARANWYSTMTQNGLMTRDECRMKENLPPMGGNAAVLTIQSNMLPIDALGAKPAERAAADALMAWLGMEGANKDA